MATSVSKCSYFYGNFRHKVTRLKNSSRYLQANYAISFYFYLYLMLYTCAVRFDVIKNFEIVGVCI